MSILQGIATLRSDRLTHLFAALAALALGGCATTYPMMPAPVLYTGPEAGHGAV